MNEHYWHPDEYVCPTCGARKDNREDCCVPPAEIEPWAKRSHFMASADKSGRRVVRTVTQTLPPMCEYCGGRWFWFNGRTHWCHLCDHEVLPHIDVTTDVEYVTYHCPDAAPVVPVRECERYLGEIEPIRAIPSGKYPHERGSSTKSRRYEGWTAETIPLRKR